MSLYKYKNTFVTELTFDENITVFYNSLIHSLKQDNTFFVIDDFFKPKYENLSIANLYWVHATEYSKTFDTVLNILDSLHQSNLKRSGTIVAIGGGVTLDMVAFCASIYKRGCNLVLIPTTIIAMIDACIGGKTGINYKNIKNHIGTFYPANNILINYHYLNLLPSKELKNGYAELIKMMILTDRGFFRKDFQYIMANRNNYIQKAIYKKSKICSLDLTDKGIRRSLNLGHTFAHLFESITDFRISHGEAVALGLDLDLKLSLKRKLISKDNYDSINSHLHHFCNIPKLTKNEMERIKHSGKDLLLKDKKNNEGIFIVLINNKSIEYCDTICADELIDFVVSEL